MHPYAARRAARWLGTAADIDGRRQAEQQVIQLNEELQRRVNELQTLLDVIPIGIGIAEDPRCERITVNPAFARQLRISPDQNASLNAPSGERPTTFKVYKDGRELAPQELPMQVAASHGVSVADIEVDVIHDDGEVCKLLEYAAPLFDEQGQVRGVVGAFLDITARKRAEEERAAICWNGLLS